MAHLRSLALLLEVPWGEEVKVWTCSVRACWGDYIFRWRQATRPPSTRSFLFFFELLAPAFLAEVDLKVWCDPRYSQRSFFLRGLFAGDLSCLERLGLGGLLRWQKRIGCPTVWSRGDKTGLVKDGACGSGAVGHKGSWPRLYRERRPPPSIKITCFCVSFIRNQLQRRQTHTHLNLKHFITHSHTHVGVTYFNTLLRLSVSLNLSALLMFECFCVHRHAYLLSYLNEDVPYTFLVFIYSTSQKWLNHVSYDLIKLLIWRHIIKCLKLALLTKRLDKCRQNFTKHELDNIVKEKLLTRVQH